jgi:hypothetical protein
MSFLEIIGGLSIADALLSDSSEQSRVSESDIRRAIIRGCRSAGVQEDDVSTVTAHIMVELEEL